MRPQSTTIITDYVLLVRRRWRVLAAAAVIGLLLAVLAGVLAPSASEPATSRLLLTAPAKHSFVPPKNEVATLATLAESNQVLKPVSRELGLDEPLSSLRDDVTGSQEATGVILITVTHGSTDESLQVVQAITRRMPGAIEDAAASVKGRASQISTAVLDPGSVSEAQTSSGVRPSVIVLGLVGGLGIGFAIVILLELAAPRLRDPRNLSEEFGLGTLGAIPASPTLNGQAVVVDGSADGAAVGEPFRRLRTNVQAINFGERPRSLLVASALDGEGKTVIALNLAAALALGGERVTLLDCDLRRGDASSRLGLDGQPGLSQVLRGEAGADDATAEHNGFAVIPAGQAPPNPSELLASDAMSDLLVGLNDAGRTVIVDTPAALTFADAAELAPRCGKTVLVAWVGRTRTRQLEEALMAFKAVDADVVGAVLNGVPKRNGAAGLV